MFAAPNTASDVSALRWLRNDAADARGVLLVALHGFGKSMAQLFDLFLQCDPALPLVSVQAPHRIGPGAWRWFGYQSGSSTDILEDEWRAGAERLEAVLDALARAHPHQALCLAGHSQGAMMALDAAAARPDIVRHCICINGRLLPQTAARFVRRAPSALAGLRVLVAHGTEDTVVPLHKGEAARDALRGYGAQVDFAAGPGGHDASLPMVRHALHWLAGDSLADGAPPAARTGLHPQRGEPHENP